MSNLETFLDDVEFEYGEEVIIRNAEVEGWVVGIKFDTVLNEGVYYNVQYPYGSIYLLHEPGGDTGDYDSDEGWFHESFLRKVKG